MITLEEKIQNCVAGALQGKPPANGSEQMTDLVAYVTSLAQGRPVNLGGESGVMRQERVSSAYGPELAISEGRSSSAPPLHFRHQLVLRSRERRRPQSRDTAIGVIGLIHDGLFKAIHGVPLDGNFCPGH